MHITWNNVGSEWESLLRSLKITLLRETIKFLVIFWQLHRCGAPYSKSRVHSYARRSYKGYSWRPCTPRDLRKWRFQRVCSGQATPKPSGRKLSFLFHYNAFRDMLRWRESCSNKFSFHGNEVHSRKDLRLVVTVITTQCHNEFSRISWNS